MCLGVPGRVIEIEDGVATVDFFGVKRRVRLDVVDAPVAPGDYVLNHVGFAIRRIPAEEIADTLALYDELLRSASGRRRARSLMAWLRRRAAADRDGRRTGARSGRYPRSTPCTRRPARRACTRSRTTSTRAAS